MRNLNEEFLSVLSDYDGTVDDRRKKFLVDTYGYSTYGSVQNMEFTTLRNLGYTGTIDDMWSKYLQDLGGVGLSAKATLLSTTFYGGFNYSVANYNPDLVFDFTEDYYRTSGSATTFDDAITHTRASSATYVDSNGVLQTAGINEPRLNHHVYNGDTWVNKGLLHESEARTNYILNSDTIEQKDVYVTPQEYTLSFQSGQQVLSEISEEIASTAVDVFVYDTSKDSDGGAWRTGALAQASSWYNETLNTATRGSRREFPAVAVIVAESNKVTIYDGDDPSLPMWMVFSSGDTAGGHTYFQFWASAPSPSTSSVFAANGVLAVGVNGSEYSGLATANFVGDSGYQKRGHQSQTVTMAYPISGREIKNISGYVTSGGIVNGYVNDVAMTVLPDAPIDPATGLPVPTIAVATAGGISVITDSGAVYDSAYTGNAGSISFTDDNGLLFALHTSASNSSLFLAAPDVFVSDGWASTTIGGNSGLNGFPVLGTTANDSLFSSGLSQIAQAGGLSKILWNSTENQSLLNYTTSTYNTGWMPGDIKGAFLSDTDDTDLVGGELVTNGTFDTDADWTKDAGVTITVGQLVATSVSNNAGASQSVALSAGTTLQFSIDVGSQSGGRWSIGFTNAANQIIVGLIATAAGVFSSTVTLPQDVTSVRVYMRDGGGSGAVNSVSVKLADADRSVSANGLVVNGTITRTPVATGAELVAYSGFSSSNYLEQPYNSDLDFGTGDFCVMGWHKSTGSANNADILYRGKTSPASDDRYFQIARWASGSYRFILGRHGITSDGVIYAAGNLTTWVHICGIVRSGVIELYLNGDLVGTDTTTIDVSQADAVLRIGRYTYDMVGSAALLRISATAPTAEQIKKIYEDEKVLFQENAAATLYGSSDAVTALAHDPDTDLLHVGTSAGRSVFDGLQRIDNTTTAVITAISASGGRVVEQ